MKDQEGRPLYVEHNPFAKNMDLRDYFAGQVIVGLIQNSSDMDFSKGNAIYALTKLSYAIADRMINMRKGDPS